MSSTLRKFSQIPVRTKYLLGVSDVSDGGQLVDGELFGAGGASVIRVTNGAFLSIGAVATTDEITAAAAAAGANIDVYTGDRGSLLSILFKDMGRSITVYDPANGDAHIAVYRECQLVKGVATEGVPEDSPLYGADYYVRVWAADGLGVAVARTG